MKRSWFICSLSLFCLLSSIILLDSAPEAAVNQVDGQVVPLTVTSGDCPGDINGCIQTGLNYGEGINPPADANPLPGPIDAVLDANTGPEAFLVPQSPGPGGGMVYNSVTFRLLQEGAGYENIFGWYNVEDPSLRFPVIFSCRDADSDGDSDRSLYEGPSYSGGLLGGEFQVTVDFQREHAAGRYLGGQIGFYLLSPEGSANRTAPSPRTNCATDPDDQGILVDQGGGVWVPSGPIDDDNYNGTSDTEGFGRIYYTENKLNNDGNYVHYLIYQSQANPDHYYFGFEDLFRGGDNDYEDTLVKVEGLVPDCQPSQEICNGVDDNCNDQIDENVFSDCSTACGEGQARCQFSNDGNAANDWVDCSAPVATAEDCNGFDDDCDGIIDNNLPAGAPCLQSGCPGQEVCVSGAWQCQAPDPSPEICDGLDNDCNTLIDDGVFAPCSTACGEGQARCQFTADGNPENDWVDCNAPPVATEICDGADNDCDGTIDNSLPGGAPCSAAGCPGQLVCEGGQWVCDAPQPTVEVCDGQDNNCNAAIDEGLTRPCVNACGVGVERCQFTGDNDPTNNWIDCSAPAPNEEICNNFDDDCNGVIDDNLPEGPECAIGGCRGRMRCVGGQMICGAKSPTVEICDGLDNDCDDQVDEDLIRSCLSPCGFGVEQCQFTDDDDPENNWTGCTAPLPSEEVCDGVDNDCDGQVDEDVPGQGAACDDPSGKTCEQGEIRCVGGEFICVGATVGSPEICDCKDNDCDGDIDEGTPCPSGTQCVECGCRAPCSADEFGCPAGFICKNDFCIPDKCANVICDEGKKCIDGACVDPCAEVQCSAGETCKNGSCVEKSCYGAGCPAGQLCLEGSCQADSCAAVTCSQGEYCNRGQCKPSCGAALCGEGARCVDGRCLENPCAGITCPSGIRCLDGRCDSDCEGVTCGVGRICESGECVDNPCTGVRCYGAGETCVQGQCISPQTFIGERSELIATGGGGLSCQLGGGPEPPWLLLLGLALFLRRRIRR